MPRPIWKGQISFGLVTIPVVLYSGEAPASSGISFHLVDRKSNSRVRNQRVSEKTGEPVEWDDIIKGYELDDGSYITFEEDELKEFEAESNQSVEISDFVDAQDIEFGYFDKPYYLIPEKRGRKGYVILREALRESKKVGIAKVVIRTREYLSALIPDGQALFLYLLRYEEELRKPNPEDLPGSNLADNNVSEKELDIALQLIEAMSSKWEPAKYREETREALKRFIEERAEKGGRPIASGDEKTDEAASGEVIDIMSLLKASMDKAKSADDKPKSRKRS